MTIVRGWDDHRAAVKTLLASYAEIPAGSPVRLAKKTSNLFRPRSATSAKGLDVSGLDGVIAIDAGNRTADVQGMCTYEHLVEATLPHGLIPLVVPQLRTITLGGAVTGLGIESTSFRNGLPHESVLEMDILTGAGEVVMARPARADDPGEHADLFASFPNSYGSLATPPDCGSSWSPSRNWSGCATSDSMTRPRWARRSRPSSSRASGRASVSTDSTASPSNPASSI